MQCACPTPFHGLARTRDLILQGHGTKTHKRNLHAMTVFATIETNIILEEKLCRGV